MSLFSVPPPDPALSRRIAVVGVGETDFRNDYQAARARLPDYVPPTPESLANIAFERALKDSGLDRSDIDGLAVAFMYGGPEPREIAKMLELAPRHLMRAAGIMAGPLPQACAAIASGKCDTIALIYAVASRSTGRKFGGQVHVEDSGAPTSYYYHHPWGWSSQAAHWAFIWQRYRDLYGVAEEDLGAVALQLRQNAIATPQAIMQKPLTIEDYLAARFVVRPLRLLDLCLVNDGGVCLIVRRADLAGDLRHEPIALAGWGEAHSSGDKLDALVKQRLRPQFQAAGAQTFAMAGIEPATVGHFEGYDASSIHLIDHLEGHGFVPEGTGLEHSKSGAAAIGGSLPVNTSGGMLSGAYMHGWHQVVEIVRQLRHEAGPRQIPDVEVSMLSLAQTDQVHPLLFTRGIGR